MMMSPSRSIAIYCKEIDPEYVLRVVGKGWVPTNMKERKWKCQIMYDAPHKMTDKPVAVSALRPDKAIMMAKERFDG